MPLRPAPQNTFEEIRSVLLKVDLHALDGTLLEAFLKQLPSGEEASALADMQKKGKVAELGKADRFLLHIMDVPLLGQRLEAMVFVMKFDETVKDITPDLNAVITAADAVRLSKSFHKLLEIVLLIGNYLNAGGSNAGSFGFKLTLLNNLRNTKTASNTSTLLHFLAEVAEEQSRAFPLALRPPPPPPTCWC